MESLNMGISIHPTARGWNPSPVSLLDGIEYTSEQSLVGWSKRMVGDFGIQTSHALGEWVEYYLTTGWACWRVMCFKGTKRFWKKVILFR